MVNEQDERSPAKHRISLFLLHCYYLHREPKNVIDSGKFISTTAILHFLSFFLPLFCPLFSKFTDYSVYTVARRETNAINQKEINLWINVLNGLFQQAPVKTFILFVFAEFQTFGPA
jgi:hypothetical protein